MCSQYFPAWYLGTFPDRSILLASYQAEFAAKWGRRTRDVVNSAGPLYFHGIQVRDDSSAANRWEIAQHGGGMETAGVGGALTGKGADIFVIDDPVENAEQANSLTYREKLWEWYQAVAYTRLEPGGAIVLIQTRWHADDLAGRLLREMERGGDKWVHLHMPALAEEGDILGRALNEPLWPERYPLEALRRIRRTLGPYWWASLYQGRPVAVGGDIFQREWWRRYAEPPAASAIRRTIQVWDTAFEVSETNDYSACSTWVETTFGYVLLHVWRGQVGFPELKRRATSLYERFKPSRVLVEKAASGHSLIQELRAETKIPILPIEAKGDKQTRAHAVTGLIESGRVWIPEAAEWLDDFLDEVGQFPRGAHDDQVDTMVYALHHLAGISGTDAVRIA